MDPTTKNTFFVILMKKKFLCIQGNTCFQYKKSSSYDRQPVMKTKVPWLFLVLPCSEVKNLVCWRSTKLGQLSHWPSIWWSKCYFDKLKIKQWVAGSDLEHSKLFIFVFIVIINEKINWKDFCKKLQKIYLEHQTLGRWDNRPIYPATQRIILMIVGFQLLS